MGCMVVPFLFFTLCTGGFVWVISQGVAGPGSWAGLTLAVLLTGAVLYGAVVSICEVRLFPYYDQRLPGAETYLGGQAIARNCLRLDQLAKHRDVKAISEFGFADPLAGETRPWHAAAEGLATVEALVAGVKANPKTVDDPGRVLRELELIRDAFVLAQKAGVRFAFLLELGDGTNAQVWEIRQGHIG